MTGEDPTASDAAAVGAVVKAEILHEWRVMVEAGHVNAAGLAELRTRLAGPEFDSAAASALQVMVIRRLSKLRGLPSPAEDDCWAAAVGDERLWAGFADTLPDTMPEPPRRW